MDQVETVAMEQRAGLEGPVPLVPLEQLDPSVGLVAPEPLDFLEVPDFLEDQEQQVIVVSRDRWDQQGHVVFLVKPDSQDFQAGREHPDFLGLWEYLVTSEVLESKVYVVSLDQ